MKLIKSFTFLHLNCHIELHNYERFHSSEKKQDSHDERFLKLVYKVIILRYQGTKEHRNLKVVFNVIASVGLLCD